MNDKEQDRLVANHVAQNRIKDMEGTLARFGIVKRFIGKTLDNYQAETDKQKYARWAACNLVKRIGGGETANAIFLGKPGTGKNHLATGITRELILAKKTIIATTTIKMIQHFRSTWRKGTNETEKEVYQKYTTPDLLILDEVGIQYGTESERIIVFDILNERYGEERSNLLITNLKMEELSDYISERLIDRLKEDGCDIVVFDWQSHRGGNDEVPF